MHETRRQRVKKSMRKTRRGLTRRGGNLTIPASQYTANVSPANASGFTPLQFNTSLTHNNVNKMSTRKYATSNPTPVSAYVADIINRDRSDRRGSNTNLLNSRQVKRIVAMLSKLKIKESILVNLQKIIEKAMIKLTPARLQLIIVLRQHLGILDMQYNEINIIATKNIFIKIYNTVQSIITTMNAIKIDSNVNMAPYKDLSINNMAKLASTNDGYKLAIDNFLSTYIIKFNEIQNALKMII